LLFYVCSFDDFLKDMKQSKRKNIRQERKKVGIHIKKFIDMWLVFLEFYPIALSCVVISIGQLLM